VYNLPEKYGPVLFALNDSGSTVSLTAVTAAIPGSSTTANEDGVNKNAQPAFQTVVSKATAPQLLPPTLNISLAVSKTATFVFAKPITKWASGTVTDAQSKVVAAPVSCDKNLQTVTVDVSSLPPGQYTLKALFSYLPEGYSKAVPGTAVVTFTVGP
jgi:hypothetical protein